MLDLQKLMGQMQEMSEQLQREAQQLTVKLDHSVFIIVLNSFISSISIKRIHCL